MFDVTAEPLNKSNLEHQTSRDPSPLLGMTEAELAKEIFGAFKKASIQRSILFAA